MLPTTMKALYAERCMENCYHLTERPVPKPGPGELLLKVGATGICHTDVIIHSGRATHPVYPFIPGHEFSGTIVELGPGVKGRRVGERGGAMQVVICHTCRNCLLGRSVWMCDHGKELGAQGDGAFAEYVVIPAENFVPIPDSMSLEEATLVEPLANAEYAVAMSRILHGDKVVVIGPGPIGILCARVAMMRNPAEVILTGTRPERLQLARERFGIENTLDITRTGAQQYLVEELLENRGADVVVEASGSLSGLELAVRIAGKEARIAMEGTQAPGETVPISRLTIKPGVSMINIVTWRRLDYFNSMQYVEQGKIDILPLMSHKFPLSRWEEAFDLVTNRKSECMKILVTPD